MNKTLLSFCLATTFFTHSSQAEIISPDTDMWNTGGSELLLIVQNEIAGQFFVLDTNIAFNDALSLNNEISRQFDFSAMGIDSSNAVYGNSYTWSLLAADSVSNTSFIDLASLPDPFDIDGKIGERILTTPRSQTPDNWGGELLIEETTVVEQLINDVNQGLPPNSFSNDIDLYYGSGLNVDQDLFLYTEPYFVSGVIEYGADLIPELSLAGNVDANYVRNISLSSEGALFMASTPDISPIPVPASIWLFISGLSLLVVKSYKRKN